MLRMFLLGGFLSIYACSDASKSYSDEFVEGFCASQYGWMETCSLDSNFSSSGSCEEGILSVVQGCEQDVVERYGIAYSDFYSCLQNLEYCPVEGADSEAMDICTVQFETSIEGLELRCEDFIDEGNDPLGSYSIEPQAISFEEAPIEGTSLLLLDDQQEEIVFEEPFAGFTSIFISSNGRVQLGGVAEEDCCFGQTLQHVPDRIVVAAAWADLNPESSGDIRWFISDEDSRSLTVIYEQVPLCCADEAPVNSWLRIWEEDQRVEIHVGNIQSEYPVTIGVQYEDGVSILPEHHAQGISVSKESWVYKRQGEEE